MTRRYFDFWDMEREVTIRNRVTPMLDLNPMPLATQAAGQQGQQSLSFEEMLRITATLLCPVGCLGVWSEAPL